MSRRAPRAPKPKAPRSAAQPEAAITGAQLRAARALLDMSQRQLSRLARVSSLTIVRMEAGNGPVTRRASLVASILKVLTERGIRFIRSNAKGEGVILHRAPRARG